MSLPEEFERYCFPPKETLQSVMEPVKAILFDMDGPLCHLFGSYPASEVTHNLKLELNTLKKLPEEAMLEDDFFKVLWAVERTGEPMYYWEQALTELEKDAALSAPPAPFIEQLFPVLEENLIGRAIVTNNNTEAAYQFLRKNKLEHLFGKHVFGRCRPDFRELKPNPLFLNNAMRSLQVDPAECLMIGDSVTDYQAAKAAHVPFLGYSHTFSGAKKLLDAGAENVIPDYAPLLELYVEYVENDFRYMYR